jgi:hypothetical protein
MTSRTPGRFPLPGFSGVVELENRGAASGVGAGCRAASHVHEESPACAGPLLVVRECSPSTAQSSPKVVRFVISVWN